VKAEKANKVKAKKCTAIFCVLMIISLNAMVLKEADSQYPDNTLFLDPPSIIDTNLTQGSQFTVGINISYVESLRSWQIKIRYNPALLYTNYSQIPSQSLIKEGPFLKAFGSSTTFHAYLDADYLLIACSINTNDWVDGGSADLGYLATITFTVLRNGETLLDLYDTLLINPNPPPNNKIDHTSQDGYFRNVASGTPTASFVHTPTFPLWSENVTFDASTSSDPDGIARYLWFFGDKDPTTQKENTANETDPITYHQYLKTVIDPAKNFTVRLIVIDNTGTTGNLSARVLTVVSSRVEQDLAIVNVSVNSTSVEPGQNLAITVYIQNQGNSSATFNVTTYYDWSYYDWNEIATQKDITLNASDTRPLEFDWNTPSNLPTGVHNLKAEVSHLTNETDTNDNTYILGNVIITFPPSSSFTYTPTNPYVDEAISFNASASLDPDGSITGYTWDFGEWILDEKGNVTTVTNPFIVHSYNASSPYFVTLTVTDNFGANASTTRWVNVSRIPSFISLTALPTATVGSSSTINGSILPIPSTSTVTILYRPLGESVWSSLANTTTDAEGEFTHLWSPTALGTVEFKAKWDGDRKYDGSESDVATVVVEKIISSISLSATASSVTIGENLNFTGSVLPIRSGVSVTILFREFGEDQWNTLASVTTDQNGKYFFSWEPSDFGVYEVKARWEGDDLTYGAESDVLEVLVSQGAEGADGGVTNDWLYVAVGVGIVAIGAGIAVFLFFRKKR